MRGLNHSGLEGIFSLLFYKTIDGYKRLLNENTYNIKLNETSLLYTTYFFCLAFFRNCFEFEEWSRRISKRFD